MTAVLPTFIDRLTTTGSDRELTEAMNDLAAGLGLSSFAYLYFENTSRNAPAYFTTYSPEWVCQYERRRYHEIDPVVLKSRESTVPFFWDNRILGRTSSPEQKSFFREATDFGIECGLSIPVYDSRGQALVTFRSDLKSRAIKRDIEAHRHVLHFASIYFHIHARRKLDDAAGTRPPSLSQREVTCLQWLIRGKTAWEIGEVLGISRRTVVFHLENAKHKLHAVSLPQAVATALYHKLIEFEPPVTIYR
jgi:LuxR family transcriptional regulator, activator of conjugal transfer of Ti plasmids